MSTLHAQHLFKMSKILNMLDDLSAKELYLPIVILSMILATQIQYIQHGWINPDTVLYFESARLFTIGDWQAAVKVFNWPLYSICIAAVHKLTALSIHKSAQLLSILFFGITTASFLKVIELAGGTNRTMYAGALILFSSQYLVGGVLEMLMRDQGFWAFYLTSLVFFIKFYQSKTYTSALLWQICAVTATLFRIEAISFLVLLPTLLLLSKDAKWSQRINDFIKCNFLNIIATLCILAATVLSDMSISQFGRLKEVFSTNLFAELTNKFFTQSKLMSELVLGGYLEEFAVQGLLLTFIYVMISKTITTAGLVNLGLATFACRAKNHLMNTQAFHVLEAAAIIAIINMALIIIKVFVLSGRYVIALGLVFMILASFKLGDLLKHFNTISTRKDQKLKWLTVAILIFMLLGIIKNILPKTEGYNYMQDAAAWIKENNKKDKPVFYDDSRIGYYLNAPFTRSSENTWKKVEDAIRNTTIKNYDLLVISHSKNRPSHERLIFEKLPEFKEIKRFSTANEKKSIIIYSRHPE